MGKDKQFVNVYDSGYNNSSVLNISKAKIFPLVITQMEESENNFWLDNFISFFVNYLTHYQNPLLSVKMSSTMFTIGWMNDLIYFTFIRNIF